MEHRLSERVPIPVPILIYHNGVPAISSESSDLSLDGMFVLTGDINYSKNTRIDVEFSTSRKADAKRIRLPAIIVHRSKWGFGLMFTGMNMSGYKALQNLIQTWKASQAKNKKEHETTAGEHPELWYQ